MSALHLLQWLGLALWRGGVLVVVAGVAVLGARVLLRWVALPRPLLLGGALVLGGLLLVVLSLIVERIGDLRRERDLRA